MRNIQHTKICDNSHHVENCLQRMLKLMKHETENEVGTESEKIAHHSHEPIYTTNIIAHHSQEPIYTSNFIIQSYKHVLLMSSKVHQKSSLAQKNECIGKDQLSSSTETSDSAQKIIST